jgi:hypothetical protein
MIAEVVTSPWGPAAVIGAVVAVGMLIFKAADYMISKSRQKQYGIDTDRIVEAIRDAISPLAETCQRTEGQATRAREICQQCWAMHDSYNDDGAPKWFVPHALPGVLQDVSRACERLAETQKAMMETQREMAAALSRMQQTQQTQCELLERLSRELAD